MYIVSLIALTIGVVLSIAIPCYLHSTFHANRQYNKIVRRVNKEISDTYINQDLLEVFQDRHVIEFENQNSTYYGLLQRNPTASTYSPVLLMMGDSNPSIFYNLVPQFQTTKKILQYQIKQVLEPIKLSVLSDDDETSVVQYNGFEPLIDLDYGYEIFCECNGIPFDDKIFKGAYDILFKPGHFCDLDKENNSVFSDKTIKMIKDFIKDYEN